MIHRMLTPYLFMQILRYNLQKFHPIVALRVDLRVTHQ